MHWTAGLPNGRHPIFNHALKFSIRTPGKSGGSEAAIPLGNLAFFS